MFYIYNMESEEVREVTITPNRNWGGQGLLGCDVSFGYLNKIPLRKKDRKRLEEKGKMKGIFGRLTGDE